MSRKSRAEKLDEKAESIAREYLARKDELWLRDHGDGWMDLMDGGNSTLVVIAPTVLHQAVMSKLRDAGVPVVRLPQSDASRVAFLPVNRPPENRE